MGTVPCKSPLHVMCLQTPACTHGGMVLGKQHVVLTLYRVFAALDPPHWSLQPTHTAARKQATHHIKKLLLCHKIQRHQAEAVELLHLAGCGECGAAAVCALKRHSDSSGTAAGQAGSERAEIFDRQQGVPQGVTPCIQHTVMVRAHRLRYNTQITHHHGCRSVPISLTSTCTGTLSA